jgi:hypothetical protein
MKKILDIYFYKLPGRPGVPGDPGVPGEPDDPKISFEKLHKFTFF